MIKYFLYIFFLYIRMTNKYYIKKKDSKKKHMKVSNSFWKQKNAKKDPKIILTFYWRRIRKIASVLQWS